MSDQFDWWRGAINGVRGEIHDGEPKAGFYRCRRKGEQATAVAYWRDTKNGSLRCHVNGADTPENIALELWPFAAKEPVTHEAYAWQRANGTWQDMDEGAFSSLPSSRQVIGSNNPPTDEAELLKEQIDAAAAGVNQYAKIEDEATKAKAQSLRSRLLELAGQAKKIHKRIKDPLWERVKQIDNTYLPLAKSAEAEALKIREAMDFFDTLQLRKAQEAERVAQAERDRIEREATEAARKAEEAGKPAPPPPPMPEAPAPYQPTTTKGAYGRAASNKIVKTVTEVTDWDKLFSFLKTHAELKELMLKLAQRAVDKNFDVPGIVTQDKVRNV